MAPNRAAAKKAITARDQADPELDDAMAGAERLKLAIVCETNRHKEALRKGDLGVFGAIIGGEKIAPIALASFAVVLSVIAAVLCIVMCYVAKDQSALWATQSERCFAFAGAALAFVFGRITSR